MDATMLRKLNSFSDRESLSTQTDDKAEALTEQDAKQVGRERGEQEVK